ncbi:MAG: carbonic anhydrase [Hyphomicrobiaceae bacterium]
MSYFPEILADRYRRFKFRHFQPNQDHYEQLATFGQNPEVMVVSCCDSRCDPETIFSAMPGELFVVRNVANLIPPFETTGRYHGVSAALEFAALNLRVKHIVILGHSGCGGVRACLEEDAARQTEAQFIRNWMSMLDEARAKILAKGHIHPGPEQRAALEREGIKTSLANLRTFPCIQILESKGRVALHGAYFDIATGELSVLNDAADAFVPV